MNKTMVYAARKIITMDPTRPEATHVAVRDGRVLAVGDADCAAPWGKFERVTIPRLSVLCFSV